MLSLCSERAGPEDPGTGFPARNIAAEHVRNTPVETYGKERKGKGRCNHRLV